MLPISAVTAAPSQSYTARGQGTMVATPISLPQPVAPSQIDEAWTEHTAPNSMKYFYNGITKESTFTKPKALMRGNGSNPSAEQPWVEYKDATTGKEYYSNGTITTWEKPDGFEISAKVHPEVNDDERPKKKKKTSPPEKVAEFSSKSDATAGFKGLLLAKDIQPTMKWNDVVKTCSSDPRWAACEILTQGERKQALAEYQTKRANELRDLEREERMRAKDAFTKLLADVLSAVDTFNPVTSRFIDIRDFLSKDERFYAVDDDPAREALFLEFCEEMRKREERNKRNKKREAKLSLFSFLRECEESGELTFSSKW
jgi:pre-mRNA-processing factor 40